MKYSVSALEVRGNKANVWKTVSACQIGTVDISEEVLEEDSRIFAVLTQAGYLEGYSEADFYIEGDVCTLLVREIDNDKPFIQLDAYAS